MFVRSRPLWRLSVLPPRRRIITSRLPDVKIPTTNFNDHVLSNVDKYADRTALVEGLTGRSFSYADVKAAIHRVASGLTRRRFQQRQVLSLYTANCPEAVLVYHGALAAGGAVSLVSSSGTKAELVRQLTNTSARVLVATEAQVATAMSAAAAVDSVQDIYVIGDNVPEGCRSVRELTEDDDGGASPWGQLEVLPDDVAILPHSSGTSGLPKTVILTNRNMVANMAEIENMLDVSPGAESFIGMLPFVHLYPIICTYSHGFYKGAKIVILPGFRPEQLLQSMEEHQTTKLHAVLPILLFLLQSSMTEKFDLSSLERIMSSGASLQHEVVEALVKKFSKKNPNFQVTQGYGLTETEYLTIIPRSRDMPGPKHGSVGILVPNTECRFVNPITGDDIPDGEEGEIVVRGPQIMPGYLNGPEETAAALRDGWMYTGDVGKVDSDGYFYITDRVKELIKYKGLQVAPAQLEDLLLTHPCVSDCAVVGKKDERVGEVPVAFVVRSGEIEAGDLQRFVAQRLSNKDRLRGGVRFIDKIPRSLSGKILRRKLRDLLNPEDK